MTIGKFGFNYEMYSPACSWYCGGVIDAASASCIPKVPIYLRYSMPGTN